MAKKRSLVKLEKVRNADYLKLENFKEIPLVVLDHYNRILSIFCFSLLLCVLFHVFLMIVDYGGV